MVSGARAGAAWAVGTRLREGRDHVDEVRLSLDRTMRQAIAEGKPWSGPGADEDRDEDGDEGEEETEGP